MADSAYDAEDWRTIARAPDYVVSNFGRVMRTVQKPRCRAGKILKATASHGGYGRINLRHNGRTIQTFVHTLVAETFIGPRPGGRYEVAHGDGDKGNNRAENLRWATVSENQLDRRKHGTSNAGERNGNARLTAVGAGQIRSAPREVACATLAERFNVSVSTVWAIRRGKKWIHHG